MLPVSILHRGSRLKSLRILLALHVIPFRYVISCNSAVSVLHSSHYYAAAAKTPSEMKHYCA